MNITLEGLGEGTAPETRTGPMVDDAEPRGRRVAEDRARPPKLREICEILRRAHELDRLEGRPTRPNMTLGEALDKLGR